MESALKELEKILEKAKNDGNILAIMLFGSYARNEKFTDIDVCLVLKPAKFDRLFLSKKKLEYQAAFPNLDIQIFQQLPLYVRMSVLKDGKTIFCRNEDLLYDLSFSTVREFEYFKPRYLSYLEGVSDA